MQRRFWNWRDDDLTADINQWLQGLIDFGRYRGFDAALDVSMILKINHQTTGATRVTTADNWTSKFGVVSTKQGTIIQEYNTLRFNIDPTPQNRHRKDILIVDHSYEQVVGGEQALYSIIKGEEVAIEAQAVTPALTDPVHQTLLGTLNLPANTTSLNQSGVTYTQAPQPNFANHVDFITTADGFFITDLNASGNKIVQLKDPEDNQDAATKYYVDQAIANNVVWASEAQRGIAKLIAAIDVTTGVANPLTSDNEKIVTLRRLIRAYDLLKATQLQANSDTNNTNHITPKTLGNRVATENRRGVAAVATVDQALAGVDDTTIITPFKLKKALPIYPIILELGIWSMTGALPYSKTLPHGLLDKWDKIVAMDVLTISDDQTTRSTPNLGNISADSEDVTVVIDDITGTNSSSAVNRGHITFWIQENLVANNILIVNAGGDFSENFVEGVGSTIDLQLNGYVEVIGSTIDATLWEIESSPATSNPVLLNPENLDAVLQTDVYGIYTLKLTALTVDNDTDFDTVDIEVVEYTNQPPVINSILYAQLASADPTFQPVGNPPNTGAWQRTKFTINASDPDGDPISYSIRRIASFNNQTGEMGAEIALGNIVLNEDTGIPNVYGIRGLTVGTASNADGNSGFFFFKVIADDGNGGTDEIGMGCKIETPVIEVPFFMSMSPDSNTSQNIYDGSLIINQTSDIAVLSVAVQSNTLNTGSAFQTILNIGSTGSTFSQFLSVGTHVVQANLVQSSMPISLQINTDEVGRQAVATFTAYDINENVIGTAAIVVQT